MDQRNENWDNAIALLFLSIFNPRINPRLGFILSLRFLNFYCILIASYSLLVVLHLCNWNVYSTPNRIQSSLKLINLPLQSICYLDASCCSSQIHLIDELKLQETPIKLMITCNLLLLSWSDIADLYFANSNCLMQ